jgi:transposase
MKSNAPRSRIDVNLEELDGIIDGALQAPLSDSDGRKLKAALHAMAEQLLRQRTTEKTKAVLPKRQPLAHREGNDADQAKPAVKGHGRNGASTFTGAERVSVRHETLQPGDPCPECGSGKVYRQKEPKTLVRIIGQAPLEATVFEMERLRCNGCGQLFTAAEPEGVGREKYDATAVAMIAQLR